MAKTSINTSLIKQAVVSAQANQRQDTSHVKTRGEVRGGGRKPWKQKGTGNARAGSRRSPIWAGGGITFGPRAERNHKQLMPVKMMRSAIAQLFSYLYEKKELVIVDTLAIIEPKTKLAVKILADNNATGKKLTLITNETEPELVLACRNIPNVTVIENRNVSILNLSNVRLVIMDKASAVSRGLVKAEAVKEETKKVAPKKATVTKAK
jgi:large subunit ribosomal protein L4